MIFTPIIPQDLRTTASPTFAAVNAGTLTITSGSITDSSGDIDFGNEDLCTTGTIESGCLLSLDTQPFLSGGAIAGFTKDVDGITGIFVSNQSTGTIADQRMAMIDTTGNYLAVALPSTGYVGSLFGLTRSTTAYIFNTGGTVRDMAIGTLGATDLVFGTSNLQRITILANGEVEITNTVTLGSGVIKKIQLVPGLGGSPDLTLSGVQHTLLLDGSSNTATVNLDAAPVEGQVYNFKCTDDTNTCTVGRNGKAIDGDASDVTLIEDESVTLQYDGTEWWIL